MIHGTHFKAARNINKTGFENRHETDVGFFGDGVYFTDLFSYAMNYAFDSSARQKIQKFNSETILVALVNIGRPMLVNRKWFSKMHFKMDMDAKTGIKLPSIVDSSFTIVGARSTLSNYGVYQTITQDIIDKYRGHWRDEEYTSEYCISDGGNILPLFILTKEPPGVSIE